MTTQYIIPLTPQPQTFNISLLGTVYVITISWNRPASCWVMDMFTAQNVLIIGGIPLVTGCNLLEQFAYLFPVPFAFYCQSQLDQYSIPTYTDLGITNQFLFVTDP